MTTMMLFEQVHFAPVYLETADPYLERHWVVCFFGCKPVLVSETELGDYELFRVAFTKANDFILPGKRKAKREWHEFVRQATAPVASVEEIRF